MAKASVTRRNSRPVRRYRPNGTVRFLVKGIAWSVLLFLLSATAGLYSLFA